MIKITKSLKQWLSSVNIVTEIVVKWKRTAKRKNYAHEYLLQAFAKTEHDVPKTLKRKFENSGM